MLENQYKGVLFNKQHPPKTIFSLKKPDNKRQT